MVNLEVLIEALLFVKTEPLSRKKLAELLQTDEEAVGRAILSLEEKLSERGVRLIENADSVMLGAAPEASGLIEAILKEELNKDLGRAGLETISIILYKNPILKSEVDFIRGVNSQFILRNLLVRGLIERIPNPEGRGNLYQPTFDLLRFLGIENTSALPNYQSMGTALKNFQSSEKTEEGGEEIVSDKIQDGPND